LGAIVGYDQISATRDYYDSACANARVVDCTVGYPDAFGWAKQMLVELKNAASKPGVRKID